MQTDTAHERQQAHNLLDRLAPSQLTAVRGLLEAMLDPAAHAVANPAMPNLTTDDEPVTEEDRRRFRDGQAWLARRGGKGISMEDVLAGFGLKPEDVCSGK
jgi:hypothetical protein